MINEGAFKDIGKNEVIDKLNAIIVECIRNI